MSFDLASYLGRFPEVCQRKFGRTYDFGALERDCSYLRQGKRHLVARDVLKIFDPSRTPFARYWPPPSEKQLDEKFRKERILLAPLADDERNLVEKLLKTFQNVGVVSLVLRFVHPDRFGVFSTPIVNLLLVHRATTVELYVAFCDELRGWQRHFAMPSVAATEMALWAYDQLTKLVAHPAEALKMRQGFEADIWIQRQRAAQVIGPLLRNRGPLELARILLYEDAKLAGKIAGEEYERLLDCASRRYLGKPMEEKQGAAQSVIKQLPEKAVSPADRVELRRIWETRKAAVHPGGRPTSAQLEVMIDCIERICLPWDSEPKKPR